MGLINAGDFSPVDSVRFFLRDNYYKGEVFHTDATIFTVRDAALAIGVPEPEILKSILLRVNRGEYFALALMSGVNRVEAKKLKKILCASHVCFADPDTCREWFGFSPGGVPPVGYSEQPRTLLDEDLFMYDTVWAAAGTDHDFFPVSPDELQRLTRGQKADIKKV